MTDHYIDTSGNYIGGFADGALPEDPTAINLGDNPPYYADQMWLFPGWGPSPGQARLVENVWREAQLVVIANQLLAIEEAEAAAEEGLPPPGDLLPGTRNQWLAYRTKIRAWKEGNANFPDITKRPVAPT